ncbi:hypothetical protein FACS189491_07960 [Spirochaetia bacterium]|nr:hypothetical protein FACS189491_07960 [Spirochaetia bacterium]
MNKFICIVVFFNLTVFSFSNDSRTILGSSVQIIDNENTNITMQEEIINIRLHRDFYEVDVTFYFINTGETETISLGFPVEAEFQNFSSEKEWAILSDFRSYINNALIQRYTIKEETKYTTNPPGDPHDYVLYTKWYIREVIFPGNSTTVSRVTYKAPYGHSGFDITGGYIFGTGYNWKGPIGKMVINIIHDDDIFLDRFTIGRYTKEKIVDYFTWKGSGMYKFEFNNIEPIISDRIRFYISKCNMLNAAYNEFGDSFLGWMWDEQLLYENVSDLKLYTKNQIRLFINFFYAIRGYNFKNQRYKDFFTGLKNINNENRKYAINPNFSENNFNEYEKKNIAYLLRLEKMIP